MPRRPAPATRPTTCRTRPGRRRAWSMSTGCCRPPWRSGRAADRAACRKPEAVRWSDEALTAEGVEPLPLARLAQEAHARGLVVGAAVHAFNRWQWAEADFMVDGASVRMPVDGLSVRYGGGACGEAGAGDHIQRLSGALPPNACSFRRRATTTRWSVTTPPSAPWPSSRSMRAMARSRC